MNTNINKQRRAAELTQKQAAFRMGISQSHWSDIESGRRSPTLRTLGRVANVLGCKVTDLIDD